MNDNNRHNDVDVSISITLQVVFIVLKLCKQIDWSWWWVLSPIWIGFVSSVICLIIHLILWRIRDK